MSKRGNLFVVSGFSGSGKGTVMKQLCKNEQYALSISCTSRAPRDGETNGKEYYFISHEEFVKRQAEGYFLESAIYVNKGYGTPLGFVEENLAAGKDVILEIEMQGALQVKKTYPDTILIFITPPSAAELRRRLTARGTETKELIEKRLKRAVEEGVYMDQYDYIIVKKLFADRYGAICLVKNTFDYAPMSNQIFETQEELSQFLKDNITNQEVTILNAMNFKRNDVSQDTMIKLPLPLFAKKLKELKKVKQDFSCIVDTSNALIYHLNKYIESINALNNETRTVDKVCSNMSKGKLLDSSDIKSSNIKRIIDSFNEFLCNKDNINTENNTEHYQQVKDELKEKKERIIELEKEIQELKEQNNKYKDENCSINDLLLCFDDVRNEVIELLKKPKIK